MIIRKAVKADIEHIAGIYDKIHELEDAGKLSIGWLTGIYPVQATAEAALERGDLFVAEEDGKTAGAAVINQIQMDSYAGAAWENDCPDSEVSVMHTMTINPDFFGRGVGALFVEFYEQYAREHGFTDLRIDTQEKNKTARALYKRSGFKEIGVVPCVFNGIPNVQLVLLEKVLK